MPQSVSDDGGSTWRPFVAEAAAAAPSAEGAPVDADERVAVPTTGGDTGHEYAGAAFGKRGADQPDPSAEPSVPWYGLDPVRRTHRRQRFAGAVLVGLGFLFLANEMGIFRWLNFSIIWPLVLVGVGVTLLARQSGWRR